MEHRSMLAVQTLAEDIPAVKPLPAHDVVEEASLKSNPIDGSFLQLLLDEAGRSYMKATGRRKTAHCEVTVMGQGTGRVDINGRDLLYFENKQEREQVLFPIEFTGLLGLVDVKATVSGGGPAGQAGALRYAIATCLRSFVTGDMMERMRLGKKLERRPATSPCTCVLLETLLASLRPTSTSTVGMFHPLTSTGPAGFLPAPLRATGFLMT